MAETQQPQQPQAQPPAQPQATPATSPAAAVPAPAPDPSLNCRGTHHPAAPTADAVATERTRIAAILNAPEATDARLWRARWRSKPPRTWRRRGATRCRPRRRTRRNPPQPANALAAEMAKLKNPAVGESRREATRRHRRRRASVHPEGAALPSELKEKQRRNVFYVHTDFPIAAGRILRPGAVNYYPLLSDGDDIVSRAAPSMPGGVYKRGAIMKWDPATGLHSP